MTATEGMARDYDAHSEYQRAVADTGAARIRSCVEAVTLGVGDTFVVADYGCSTGANSMVAVHTAVAAVRTRNSAQPVVAIHNDLPSNDWNQLFANVESSPNSYLRVPGPSAIPLASAISFFAPSAPARSVHLGMSFSAAHWLRTQPTVAVPGGFYFCDATGDARAALAAEADADWTTFLTARAADLATGGRLLAQMVGTDGQGNVTARKSLRAMAAVAAEMAADGKLDPKAVEQYILPAYARTVDEARAPLTRPGSPVHGVLAEVECRTDPVPNPYLAKWRSDGDAEAYGTAYAAFLRGFTESSLRDHLFAPGVPAGDLDGAVDDFFARLAARFAADPEREPFEDWTLTVVLTRT
ncbi:MAG TPA: hypothetical protein VEP49_20035 [Acidimicrobiia bacterium]|nr:hypothetical protein [Acidimicrobiia bacterium]